MVRIVKLWAHMTTLSRSTVSITEAGRIAGVSRRTVNNWIAHGKVECHRRAGGTVRVYVDSLFRAEEKPEQGRSSVEASESWDYHGRARRV